MDRCDDIENLLQFKDGNVVRIVLPVELTQLNNDTCEVVLCTTYCSHQRHFLDHRNHLKRLNMLLIFEQTRSRSPLSFLKLILSIGKIHKTLSRNKRTDLSYGVSSTSNTPAEETSVGKSVIRFTCTLPSSATVTIVG